MTSWRWWVTLSEPRWVHILLTCVFAFVLLTVILFVFSFASLIALVLFVLGVVVASALAAKLVMEAMR